MSQDQNTNTELTLQEKLNTLYDMADDLLRTCSNFSKLAVENEQMADVSVLEKVAESQYEVLKTIAMNFPDMGGDGCEAGSCDGCESAGSCG